MDESSLLDLLECSVCLERLDTTAKVLPCQHTFCRRCLESIVCSRHELRCPECRILVGCGVDELPANILLPATASLRDLTTSRSAPVAKNLSQLPCGKALYSYEGKEPGDLRFSKGDLIILRRRVDEHWYHGELHGAHGFLPASYVQCIRPLPPVPPQGKALYDFELKDKDQDKDCLTFTKDEVLTVLRRVDDNWAEGALGDKVGIFPLLYVELNDSAKQLIEMDKLCPVAVSACDVALPLDPGAVASVAPAPTLSSSGAVSAFQRRADGKKNTKKRHSFTSLSVTHKSTQAASHRVTLTALDLLKARTPAVGQPGEMPGSQLRRRPIFSKIAVNSNIYMESSPNMAELDFLGRQEQSFGEVAVTCPVRFWPVLVLEMPGQVGRVSTMEEQELQAARAARPARAAFPSQAAQCHACARRGHRAGVKRTAWLHRQGPAQVPAQPRSSAVSRRLAPLLGCQQWLLCTQPRLLQTEHRPMGGSEGPGCCLQKETSKEKQPVDSSAGGAAVDGSAGGTARGRQWLWRLHRRMMGEMRGAPPHPISLHTGRYPQPSSVHSVDPEESVSVELSVLPLAREVAVAVGPALCYRKCLSTSGKVPETFAHLRMLLLTCTSSCSPTVPAKSQQLSPAHLAPISAGTPSCPLLGSLEDSSVGGPAPTAMPRAAAVAGEQGTSPKVQLPLNVYLALYAYKPQKSDELELRKGEMYRVLEKCQDGWFKGASLRTGVSGVFPGNYVTPVSRAPVGGAGPSRSNAVGGSPLAKGMATTMHPGGGSLSSPATATRPALPITTPQAHAQHPTASPPAGSCLRHPAQPAASQARSSTPAAAHPSTPAQDRPTATVSPLRTQNSPSRLPAASLRPHSTVSPQQAHQPPLQACTRPAIPLSSAASAITPPNVSAANLGGEAGGGPAGSLPTSSPTSTGCKPDEKKNEKKEKKSGLLKLLAGASARKKSRSPPSVSPTHDPQVATDALLQGAVGPEICSLSIHGRAGSCPIESELQGAVGLEPLHRKAGSLDLNFSLSPSRQAPLSMAAIRPEPKPLPRERYRVVVSYPPQSEAEIELKEGDIVFVHKKREDGWYKGTLQRTGRTGLFPGSFVESF
ncbi:E3 ubiquitin-protein ligase SH3RF3 [Tupaia chinensis]|uniref:E3 ubiquitin-protein ligase SH3RF3 n=1 Tax=Tupaia chinensis TaxID=246437 RepID=UPI000FFCA10A|nr:E3 ubiquitin-protein ligase SH3RF3 [Tupaia chinensis]